LGKDKDKELELAVLGKDKDKELELAVLTAKHEFEVRALVALRRRDLSALSKRYVRPFSQFACFGGEAKNSKLVNPLPVVIPTALPYHSRAGSCSRVSFG
jgi:hypothetical protein